MGEAMLGAIIAASLCSKFPDFMHDLGGCFNQKNVIVLNDTSLCKYLGDVRPVTIGWRENENGETIPLEVRRLKQMAYFQFKANAIGDIIIHGKKLPLGQASAYSCPFYITDLEKNFQLDEKWILKHIQVKTYEE